MSLVNARGIIRKAYEQKYAIPAININNLEWTKAALEAAQTVNSPIILAVSMGASKYMGGYQNIYHMVTSLMKYMNISIPVVLHLDHGNFEHCYEAINSGFSSIMFDGSKLDIKENILKTTELVEYIKEKNISIETEVGGIGGEEDGITSDGELADVNQCLLMKETGIDMLACGIGNIHGIYPVDWKGLNFSLLKEINNKLMLPLVLHGGSGIPIEMIQESIKFGIAKININTECQIAFASALNNYFVQHQNDLYRNKNYDPRKVLKDGVEAIKKTIIEKYHQFNCVNRNEN
ncbi:class II fructose-1,6-bisphosphate aldolase [Ureaplasma canigenitalium]|uniref:class II fructose-1,6-bisphosphate aldolase n=1 Tax=Ureaplasma canigenitalium TaxID=42092 RepID=UPI0004E1BD33|nr:class II fructose-1,6-bisphosphate aldolase [Ureaplasma canigenitalium]